MARTAARIYVPIDVAFLDDEKILCAGERAAWLYLAILLRIKVLDSDGIITRAQIARTGVPRWSSRLTKLVDCGLVVTSDNDTFVVPSWSRWNEIRSNRVARLQKERERKSRAKGISSGQGVVAPRIPPGIRPDSALIAVQSSAEKSSARTPQPPPVADVLRRLRHDTREADA